MKIYIATSGIAAIEALPETVKRVNVNNELTGSTEYDTCYPLSQCGLDADCLQYTLEDEFNGVMPAIGTPEWDELIEMLSDDFDEGVYEYFDEEDDPEEALKNELEELSGGQDIVLVGTDVHMSVIAGYFDAHSIDYVAI